MQRYFVKNNQILAKSVLIKDQDFHHIKNVMRMKIGDEVIIVNENCQVFSAKIVSFLEKEVELHIINEKHDKVELDVDVTIAFGLVKREKTEEVLRRICELGAVGFMSVEMKRSVVRIKETKNNKLDRLSMIAKEACEQSHRSRLLKVFNTIDFKQFIDLSKYYDMCLYAYEESGRQNNYSFKKYLRNFQGKKILILVGPEGGFDINEVQLLNESNFKPIGLGPRILRCETAPLYIMSAIGYEMEIKNES